MAVLQTKLITDAYGDIKATNKIMRHMVMHRDLNYEIRPTLVNNGKEELFLGHSIARNIYILEKPTKNLEQEIKKVTANAYEVAYDTTSSNTYTL